LRRLLTISAAILLSAPSLASASDLDQFGIGARPISLGGAFTALATNWTAPYYNPAGLALVKAPTMGGGYSYADYNLELDTESGNGQLEHDAERAGPLSAFWGGFATRLSLDPASVLSRIGVGLAAFIPARHTLTQDVETAPGEPRFFLYGHGRDRLCMLPAIGIRLPLGPLEATQTLAIGAGVNVLYNTKGEQVFNLGGTTGSAVSARLHTDYNVAPHVGVYYWPIEWLSLGLTWRGEISSGSHVNVVIDLTGGGTSAVPLDLKWVTLFQPHQVQLGMAVDPTEALTISLDLTWNGWSGFEDPFVTVGTLVAQTDPRFRDTIVPRLGVEWEVAPDAAVRFGYFFEPSPIPDQKGATNLIDLDKHVLSLGLGYTYETLAFDAFIQWHHLMPEKVRKDDPANSGGVGASYEASGEVFNFGLGITVTL
jgi:long-chain fatty acid transport protein